MYAIVYTVHYTHVGLLLISGCDFVKTSMVSGKSFEFSAFSIFSQ